MPVAFRSATTGYSDYTGTGFVLNRPTGVAANDALIAAISTKFLGGPITLPAGFTLFRTIRMCGNGSAPTNYDTVGNETGGRLFLAYKIATASEPSSYSFTAPSSTKWSGALLAYSGTARPVPINAEVGRPTFEIITNGYNDYWYQGVWSHCFPQFTTTVENTVLLAIFASDGYSTFYTPNGFATQRANLTSYYNTNPLAVFEAAQAWAGTRNSECSYTDPNCFGAAALVALEPFNGNIISAGASLGGIFSAEAALTYPTTHEVSAILSGTFTGSLSTLDENPFVREAHANLNGVFTGRLDRLDLPDLSYVIHWTRKGYR
jgi:hypothetical protein